MRRQTVMYKDGALGHRGWPQWWGTVAAGWELNVYSADIGNHIGFGSDMAHVLRFGSFGSGLTAFVYLHHQGAHASPGANVHVEGLQ